MIYKKIILLLLAAVSLSAASGYCQKPTLSGLKDVKQEFFIAGENHQKLTLSGLQAKDFEANVNGQLTHLYVLKNSRGMEVCITNYGARVVSVMAPDRRGKMEDVVCGYSNIKDYMAYKQNFGATIGRYAGRILNSTFIIDSVRYHLTPNTGAHSAHGGDPGFAARIWKAENISKNALCLSYLSPSGENGFPGNLAVKITYTLTKKNELDIRYEASVTGSPTVVNFTHHSFFNISGNLSTNVENQQLYVDAGSFTPYDSLKCVTGEIASVIGTPFDFTSSHSIGERIDANNPQLKVTGGYDHTFVLNAKGNDRRLAARLKDLQSGRVLEVYSNEPGLHVYTANGLKGNLIGKKGIAYPRRGAVCLETLHFADSPNKPQFPTAILRPGKKYRSHCVYRFTAE